MKPNCDVVFLLFTATVLFTLSPAIIVSSSHISNSSNSSSNISYCEDWTFCEIVKCAAPEQPCPQDKPYLLYGECGCCQYCSKTPRDGPCGRCGVDVVCREEYPTCKPNQIVSIDYCGCCRTCKNVVGIGANCTLVGPSSNTVCAASLKCVDGRCSAK